MRALQICYIRLCHKAELRSAAGTIHPRHPHAPLSSPSAASVPADEVLCSHVSPKSASDPHLPCKAPESDRHCYKNLDAAAQQDTEAQQDTQAGAAPAPEGPGLSSAVHDAQPQAQATRSHHFNLDQIQYCCFHSPLNKLVRKAFAQLQHIDNLRRRMPSFQRQSYQQSSDLLKPPAPVKMETTEAAAAGRGSSAGQSPSANEQAGDSVRGAHLLEQSQSAGSQPLSLALDAHPIQATDAHSSHAPQASGARPNQASVAPPSRDPQHTQSHKLHTASGQDPPAPVGRASGHLPQGTSLQAVHLQQQEEQEWLMQQLADSGKDKKLERELAEASIAGYREKVEPGCQAGIQLGNLYAGAPSTFLPMCNISVTGLVCCSIVQRRCSKAGPLSSCCDVIWVLPYQLQAQPQGISQSLS